MTTKTTSIQKAQKAVVPAKQKTAVQEALEVTWVLKGNLKRAQLSYLHIGAQLTQVRDRQLYAALKHPDMESYAAERLHLGKTSLYKYLLVYDWVSKSHPSWLEPKTKDFIPDLSDTTDLIWIENELSRKNLSPKTRTALEALRTKGLSGELRKGELDPYRRSTRTTTDTMKAFVSQLRKLRKRAAALANMPPEVVTYLESAIGVLKNDQTVAQHGGNHLPIA